MDGFILVPSDDDLIRADDVGLSSMDELAALRCLLLLGEPGMGKSHEIAAAAVAAEQSGHAVLSVDLGGTRDEAILHRRIFGDPKYEEWKAGSGQLHLFLDSFDEAILGLSTVGDLLTEGLRNADTARLYLRVASRSADRLSGFDEKLRDLWDRNESGVFVLAPLSRSNVGLAANDHEIDAEMFLDAVREKGIVPLATKPVTLAMLLNLDDPEHLPQTQAELYEQGLLKLAAEPTRRRDRARMPGPGQRLAIAKRVAAATLLSGRTRISLDDSAPDTTDSVNVRQLSGGSVHDRSTANAITIKVGIRAARDALKTAIFAPRGNEMTWAHQSFGEYLAAKYLTQELTSEQQASLLLDGQNNARVVPQLREVAAWAATLDEKFFQLLVARDPLVLLRLNSDSASDGDRERIVKALFTGTHAGELDYWNLRNRRGLAALSHEGLATTVGQKLRDRDASSAARELACELAELCELEETEPALVAVALDSSEALELRVSACAALRRFASDPGRRQLIPLARDSLPEDEQDELKGLALGCVCPRVVEPVDVFDWLTPQKNDHLMGTYSSFIGRELTEALDDQSLIPALEWLRRVPNEHDPMDSFGTLAERILLLAIAHLDDDEVLELLAAEILERIKGHYAIQTSRTRREPSCFADAAVRHRLVTALFPAVAAEDLHPTSLIHSRPSLLVPDDLPWLIEQLRAAELEQERADWATLIDWIAIYQEIDHALIMEARLDIPVLYEQTIPRYGPVEIESELANGMKDRWNQEREFQEEEQSRAESLPDPDVEIDRFLDLFDDGNLDAFWQVMRVIWVKPRQPSFTIESTNFTTAPGWLRASPERKLRIHGAAIEYLTRYDTSDKWLDPDYQFYPASAGYGALRFLQAADPAAFEDIATDHLEKWIPAVLRQLPYNGEQGDSEFSRLIVLRIRREHPQAFTAASVQLVRAQAQRESGHISSLQTLRPAIAGQLGEALFDLWKNEELKAEPEEQLLRELMQAGVSGVVKTATKRLTSELVTEDPERAKRLARTLASTQSKYVWSTFWPLARSFPDWGDEVFGSISWARYEDPDIREILDERELAELFLWLSDRFPHTEDPPRFGVQTQGDRQQIVDFRNGTLRLLADRGSAEAVAQISRIERDAELNLFYLRTQAEEAMRINRWVPARPQDVLKLAEDENNQVVLSAEDLQRVLLKELARVQSMLEEGQANQVWDTSAGKPKGEVQIADWIATRLKEGLKGRGIVVNREVEVRVNPAGGLGDQTDIHVDALAGRKVEGSAHVCVVIETKGCWDRNLKTAMRDQLVAKYLTPSRRHGIYMPLHARATDWADQSDWRRAVCAKVDVAALERELQTQARELSAEFDARIDVMLLDISLRSERREAAR